MAQPFGMDNRRDIQSFRVERYDKQSRSTVSVPPLRRFTADTTTDFRTGLSSVHDFGYYKNNGDRSLTKTPVATAMPKLINVPASTYSVFGWSPPCSG